jgi:carotenoid cleavage dioxygenase-like enzyme
VLYGLTKSLTNPATALLRHASVFQKVPLSHSAFFQRSYANVPFARSTTTLMTPVNAKKRKREQPHPYLTGNFAPIHHTLPLTPCTYTGVIPNELHGGEYVRNGGNPVANEDLGRDAHWFDGDGMLSGVAFQRTEEGVQPEFVNQFILTDVYLASVSSSFIKTPILPSIATLVNPLSTILNIFLRVLRTILLVVLSRLPGSSQAIKKISVANTGVLFHDGRALATCESGPPMRVALPGLETVGWFNGKRAEGEKGGEDGAGFGGSGLFSFMKEWTTAHPRVDPKTGELILFHSTFMAPFAHYSIIPQSYPSKVSATPMNMPTRLLNTPIPGISSAKMMHDFGVSFDHTVILDLPLSLDPRNLLRNMPVVAYDPNGRSRFGVFPRHSPEQIRWFETRACCIFHTANTWDDKVLDKMTGAIKTTAVNMLACRLTSASLIFSAGDVAAPQPIRTTVSQEEEQCRLYYYQFNLDQDGNGNNIEYQFALSAISFEFPSMREDMSMSSAKFIYGCSVSYGSFGAALGRVVKIDCLVKINAEELIGRGKKDGTLQPVTGCVDTRSVEEVLSSRIADDPIQVFKFPQGYFCQECRFVPMSSSEDEDDGYLLSYVFNEDQLDEHGECLPDAKSELWIIDARDMKTVVGKVVLPQRVPYGLHGNWFSEEQVLGQRPIETIRRLPSPKSQPVLQAGFNLWGACRKLLESLLG